MSKLAEEIVHDVIDEITDIPAFAAVLYEVVGEEGEKVLRGKLVGIVDQNIERHKSLKKEF